MAYCTNCGALLESTARFCPNCGTPVTAVASAAANSLRSDSQVVLVSRGTCPHNVAVDILSDLLGYTDAEALQIINNLPMATAIDLTAVQAQYVAQAMSEYGMEVAVYNGNGYVDMGSAATASVFDSNGSFLASVAAVLTGISIGNRVRQYERWTRPAPVVFRPTYRRQVPLTTYRRYRPIPAPRTVVVAPRPVVRPAPAPRPVPAPAVRPAPAPRPVPAPAVRPAPAPRPVPAPAARPAPAAPARPAPAAPARPSAGAGRPARPAPGGKTPGPRR